MESATINNAIKEVREFLNREIRGSLSREEINRIRKNFIKKKLYIIF